MFSWKFQELRELTFTFIFYAGGGTPQFMYTFIFCICVYTYTTGKVDGATPKRWLSKGPMYKTYMGIAPAPSIVTTV